MSRDRVCNAAVAAIRHILLFAWPFMKLPLCPGTSYIVSNDRKSWGLGNKIIKSWLSV